MSNAYMFFLGILAVLSAPGPTNTLLASAAAVNGLRSSLLLVPAELLGYLATVCLVGFFLHPLLLAHHRSVRRSNSSSLPIWSGTLFACGGRAGRPVN